MEIGAGVQHDSFKRPRLRLFGICDKPTYSMSSPRGGARTRKTDETIRSRCKQPGTEASFEGGALWFGQEWRTGLRYLGHKGAPQTRMGEEKRVAKTTRTDRRPGVISAPLGNCTSIVLSAAKHFKLGSGPRKSFSRS